MLSLVLASTWSHSLETRHSVCWLLLITIFIWHNAGRWFWLYQIWRSNCFWEGSIFYRDGPEYLKSNFKNGFRWTKYAAYDIHFRPLLRFRRSCCRGATVYEFLWLHLSPCRLYSASKGWCLCGEWPGIGSSSDASPLPWLLRPSKNVTVPRKVLLIYFQPSLLGPIWAWYLKTSHMMWTEDVAQNILLI